MHKHTKLIKMIDDANTYRIVIALYFLFSHKQPHTNYIPFLTFTYTFVHFICNSRQFQTSLSICRCTHVSTSRMRDEMQHQSKQPDKKCWQDKYILKRIAFYHITTYMTLPCICECYIVLSSQSSFIFSGAPIFFIIIIL